MEIWDLLWDPHPTALLPCKHFHGFPKQVFARGTETLLPPHSSGCGEGAWGRQILEGFQGRAQHGAEQRARNLGHRPDPLSGAPHSVGSPVVPSPPAVGDLCLQREKGEFLQNYMIN